MTKERDATYNGESRPLIGNICYIMGTGRSGTTILDMLLSNNPGMIGAGEITHTLSPEVVSGEVCACGSRLEACEVWGPVVREFSPADLVEAARLFRCLESHGMFFAVAFKLVSRKRLARYHDLNARLYRALAGEQGNVIVDSSKYAGRALMLSRMFPDRMQIICLTRSPEGLIQAFRKKDKEQPAKSLLSTFAYYIYTLTCFAICRLLIKKKAILMQYERMVAAPDEAMAYIEQKTGLSLKQTRDILARDGELSTGHIVVGNRIRKKGRIRFRRSDKHERLEATGKLVAALMGVYRHLLGLNQKG